MLVWTEKGNHLRIGEADNGWPLYDFICFAPQNDDDLDALKEFVEKCGFTIEEDNSEPDA